MSRARCITQGAALAERLYAGIRTAKRAPRRGSRNLPILQGLSPRGLFIEPAENVLASAREVLADSGQVFAYGNAIVRAFAGDQEDRLLPLCTQNSVEPAGPAILANLFICEQPGKGEDSAVQFAPPKNFVDHLLNSDLTRQTLPRIKVYARRPVFDDEYRLRSPGWHADTGIFVHGEDIEPIMPTTADRGLPAIERMPPHLRALLTDFSFASDADLVNGIAVMLIGVLAHHFVSDGKPLVILDGNQPGVGKTLFARVVGMLLDGREPQVLEYSTDEEELAKRICATLRGQEQSLLLFDNAKVRSGAAIESAVIEAKCLAPQVTLRVLGTSTNFERPNDLVWMITMNQTRAAADIASRCLPVRFFVEGRPETRQFGDRNPLEYARRHRREILGELFGLVIHWNQAGRPLCARERRTKRCVEIVGGILEVAGLPEFLTNLDEAIGAFGVEQEELAALAQAVQSQFGQRSAMAEAINAGQDLHLLVAARVTGKPADEVTAEERRMAKPINFGKPGGMGLVGLQQYAKASYGVDLSEDDVDRLSEAWLELFPEMREFLNSEDGPDIGLEVAKLFGLTPAAHFEHTGDRRFFEHPDGIGRETAPNGILGWMFLKTLKISAPFSSSGEPYTEEDIAFFWSQAAAHKEELPVKHHEAIDRRRASPELRNAVVRLVDQAPVFTLTGRLRAQVSYTARHNTIFQGLTADGAKLALWRLWRAGYRLVNFVHDEVLIEIPADSDLEAHGRNVEQIMIESMQEVLPDMRVGVEWVLRRSWAKGDVMEQSESATSRN